MVKKNLLIVIMTALIVISMVCSVIAITANIGNAKMILRVKPGDTISKTVLVNNINNVSVDIESFPSGDLENFTVIKNPKFSLMPGDSKNIEFTIKVPKEGTTTTKINVKFMPSDKMGGGIGLSSNVIIIATKGNETTGSAIENKTGNTNASHGNEDTGINAAEIGAGVTGFVVLVFVILLIVYLKKGSKNKGQLNKPKKS